MSKNGHYIGKTLGERAMLVRLSIKGWTGMKADTELTRDAAQRAGATGDIGIFNKRLISKQALEPVKKVANEARMELYRSTLPWEDPYRLCPVDEYESVKAKMDDFRIRYEQAADAFIKGYPDMIDEARQRLGSLFVEKEYASVEDMKARLEIRFETKPIPEADHFIANIVDKDLEAVKMDLIRDQEERLEVATLHTFEVLSGYVETLKSAIDDGGIFRDSAVSNIVSVCRSMQSMNITNNPVLSEASEKLLSVLEDLDPDTIRERNKKLDVGKLQETHSTLADAQEAMAGFMGDK